MKCSHPPRVLVIGAGIAGVCAAIEAARSGASVTMVSAGKLFSGSSFYPGTWGLGLIAPVDGSDEEDLARTICTVGCGMASPSLVKTFVHDIPLGITWLERLGVTLRRPASEASAHEAAFIPCFDHKNRVWRGLVRESMEEAFGCEIERLGIRVLEHCELIDLVDTPSGAIGGGVVYDRAHNGLHMVYAEATILAAGGTSGLFSRRLTSGDVLASAHGIALLHGARLINIEFMQMMPGLLSPKRGIVFNEKSFRYARTTPQIPRELLEARSPYGPFTSRLASRAVDLAVDAAGPEGLPLRYEFPREDVPEFVQTFTSWLEEQQGIHPTDELRIGMYAHASNGGIAIDEAGSTGIPGLFACGEVTGGMHGADRIGGLSSANGLVFGRRAGQAAAAYGGDAPRGLPAHVLSGIEALAAWKASRAERGEMAALDPSEASSTLARLREAMSDACMVVRTHEGLSRAATTIQELQERVASRAVHDDANSLNGAADASWHASYARMRAQLLLAQAMVASMLERTESRGAHYRADFPTEDPTQARPIVQSLERLEHR